MQAEALIKQSAANLQTKLSPAVKSPLTRSNKENSIPDVFTGDALAEAAEQVVSRYNARVLP